MSLNKTSIDRLISRHIEFDRSLWLPKIDELIAAQGVEPDPMAGPDAFMYQLKGTHQRHCQWVYPRCVRELIGEVEVHYLEPLESTPFGKEIANEIDGAIGFRDAIHELLNERLLEMWDRDHTAAVAGDAR